MKTVIITIWPWLDAADPTRDWFKNLNDNPIEKILLQSEVTKYNNLKETWQVTITDYDACILKLKYPGVEFI